MDAQNHVTSANTNQEGYGILGSAQPLLNGVGPSGGEEHGRNEQAPSLRWDDDDLLQEELNRDSAELERAASTKPEGRIKIPPR